MQNCKLVQYLVLITVVIFHQFDLFLHLATVLLA